MPESWWIVVAAAAVFLAGGVLVWRPIRAAVRDSRLAAAQRDFHRHREHLEAKFVQVVQVKAKRSTLGWADCEFDDDVAYVRNRSTGELTAFVAVTVATDNVEGRSAGATDAVGNLRVGTAIFRFDRDRWETDGRAILNLTPCEVIRFYRRDLEMVAEEAKDRGVSP